ncbi:hypothetical protein F511_04194 [Dorcoceras hygrometricum]|uniref:Uncharacterized protein n=1 Tax=Dorcoceras hygrometricum TaxID=472368 RepID=A0A2Z7BKS5_9LAMI|nr:hypothetical protein F511_04194 [Dorcoceras hygrometricum]
MLKVNKACKTLNDKGHKVQLFQNFTTATTLCPTDRITQEALYTERDIEQEVMCVHKSRAKTKQSARHNTIKRAVHSQEFVHSGGSWCTSCAGAQV